MLPDLDHRIAELEALDLRLNELTELIRHHTRHRISSCLNDVVLLYPMLRQSIVDGRGEVEDAEYRVNNWTFKEQFSRAIPEEEYRDADSAARRMGVLFKAFLFFVRSLHGAVHDAFVDLESARQGRRVKKSDFIGTMHDGSDKMHTAFVRDHLPAYPEWFADFMDKRNRAKLGFNHSISGPRPNVGIGFSRISEDNALKVAAGGHLRINDLIDAVTYSILIIELLVESAANWDKKVTGAMPGA